MTWDGVPIKTSFLFPPIPIRSFDWSACLDGREENGPYGFGVSREIAVADLLQQLFEGV
jgi:hypothetical protein